MFRQNKYVTILLHLDGYKKCPHIYYMNKFTGTCIKMLRIAVNYIEILLIFFVAFEFFFFSPFFLRITWVQETRSQPNIFLLFHTINKCDTHPETSSCINYDQNTIQKRQLALDVIVCF